MTAATWILMHKKPADPAAAARALKFFSWAFKKGDKMAEELDYIAMPDKVVKDIEKTWARRDQGCQRQAALRGDELAAPSGEGASSRRPSASSTTLAAAGWPCLQVGCSRFVFKEGVDVIRRGATSG